MADFWSQFPAVPQSQIDAIHAQQSQPNGQPAIGFNEQGQPIYGTPRPPNVGDPNNPNAQLASSTAVQPALPTQQSQTIAPSAPTGGEDPQATFRRIMGDLPATPANLAAKEAELKAAGIGVHRNAEGVAGKITLPNGQIVDVIQNAGLGGGGSWQWNTGGGAGGGIPGFQVGNFTGGGQYPLSSVMGTGLAAPWTTPFNAPTDITEQNDPGFQARMKMGTDAIERSAASKGTLLTGGLLKGLARYGQDFASNEYGNVYNRSMQQYMTAHDIFRQNQGDLYSRLYGVAGMGQQAAGAMGNYGNAYATNATNLQTGIGSAQSAGTVGVGNAIGNAVGGVVNAVGQLPIGGGANQTSYDPNKPAPVWGNPDYTAGTGAPWNTYQQP